MTQYIYLTFAVIVKIFCIRPNAHMYNLMLGKVLEVARKVLDVAGKVLEVAGKVLEVVGKVLPITLNI